MNSGLNVFSRRGQSFSANVFKAASRSASSFAASAGCAAIASRVFQMICHDVGRFAAAFGQPRPARASRKSSVSAAIRVCSPFRPLTAAIGALGERALPNFGIRGRRRQRRLRDELPPHRDPPRREARDHCAAQGCLHAQIPACRRAARREGEWQGVCMGIRRGGSGRGRENAAAGRHARDGGGVGAFGGRDSKRTTARW